MNKDHAKRLILWAWSHRNDSWDLAPVSEWDKFEKFRELVTESSRVPRDVVDQFASGHIQESDGDPVGAAWCSMYGSKKFTTNVRALERLAKIYGVNLEGKP